MSDKQIKTLMILIAIATNGVAIFIMGKDDIVNAIPFIALLVIGTTSITWACWPRKTE